MNKVELEYVLDFLYNGEAFMAQEELNSFLETTKELQVKGLQSNQDNKCAQSKHTEETFNVKLNTKLTKNEILTFKNQSVDHGESVLDSLEEMENSLHTSDNSLVKGDEEFLLNTNQGLDFQLEQMIEKNDGLWQCKVCGKTGKGKYITRNHAETHIEDVSHTCHICNKNSSTRNSLRTHIIDNHSNVSYTCNVCDKSEMTKMAFKIHKRTCKE